MAEFSIQSFGRWLQARCRSRARWPAAVLVAGLLAATPHLGGAQTVLGQLFDSDTGSPIEGALVRLLDQNDDEVTGYLTNAAGRFVLRAPAPGSYRARAERIGYETVDSETFALEAGQQFGLRLETSQTAIELEELRVESAKRCVVRPGQGLQVYAIWEEARKALTVQDWTQREGMYRFQMASWTRELDPPGRIVLSETRQHSSGISASPIRSAPAEELLSEGFVRENEEGGWDYFGPDAAVLLSDLFLDTHCFAVELDADRPEDVGLTFEPVDRNGPPDIAGTLWVDLKTGQLQDLEYRYTWTPWEVARGVAGGRVTFENLPNGAWIVRSWRIRMPVMAADFRVTRTGGSNIRLVGLKEVGGEITRYSTLDEKIVSQEAPRGTLEGQVWDATRERALPGATVFLSGTPYASESDDEGHFRLSDLPGGTFKAVFTHPRLDSLGAFFEGLMVEVTPGDTTRVTLGVPPAAATPASVCSEEEMGLGKTALLGVVRDERTGEGLQGVTVSVVWSSFEGSSVATMSERRLEYQATSGPGGRYRVCGLPPETLITVRAILGDRQGGPTQIPTSQDGISVLDLELGG